MGWVAAASSSDVTTRPRAVDLDGFRLVLLRFSADGPAFAFADRCPHRLVPLSAGTVEDGRLTCAYHGWAFTADGTCVELPSAGPGARVPTRARLDVPARVEEADGTVWLSLDDGPRPERDLLTNVDPAFLAAWHPVALSTEVGPEPHRVVVVGCPYSLRRTDGEVVTVEPSYGVCERWGLVWLAIEPPIVDLFDAPDAEDAAYVGAWLPPVRTPAPAGFVADNFLDVAHFPFVHAGTFGAGEERVVAPYEVVAEADGFSSVQEQWFDNPEDPGVAAGLRPVRQRRRATYVYRAPFQLMLRLEELDAGAVKTILFFVQPETAESTRIYTKLLLHGVGGVPRPDRDIVAREVAFEEAVLAEDLALQSHMTLAGLPLRPRDELHVRADRAGVALRRELDRFRARTA